MTYRLPNSRKSNFATEPFDVLLDYDRQRMPWNIRRALDHINADCSNLFLHVASFMCRGIVVPDKALSFHAKAVRCFNKGKSAKGLQFGRAFQLGRLGGNFLLGGACTSLRMDDTAAVRPMIAAHQDLFSEGPLKSFGTDKGYYSNANRKYLRSVKGLATVCLQEPGLDLASLSERDRATHRRLADRRWGIEPLIGHAKQGGQLGQSRMKTDDTTLAAGYGAIGGLQPPSTHTPPARQGHQTDRIKWHSTQEGNLERTHQPKCSIS